MLRQQKSYEPKVFKKQEELQELEAYFEQLIMSKAKVAKPDSNESRKKFLSKHLIRVLEK